MLIGEPGVGKSAIVEGLAQAIVSGEVPEILKGKKIADHVRAIIIPATQDIYLRAVENGLVKIFIEAGCVVSTPTCGPCLGGHMGILAAGERAVATPTATSSAVWVT